jgi:hypothetical protein
MRTRGKGLALIAATVVAGVVATLGGTAAAADAHDDDEASPAKRTTWALGWGDLFGKKKSKVRRADPAEEKVIRPAAAAEVGNLRREQELNAYMRRLRACDRLIDIALGNNDEEMLRQVEEMQDRVWAIYQQNASTGGGFEADEIRLSRSLADDSSGKKLLAPPGKFRDGDRRTTWQKERP